MGDSYFEKWEAWCNENCAECPHFDEYDSNYAEFDDCKKCRERFEDDMIAAGDALLDAWKERF